MNPNNTAISNTSDNGANKNVVWADNITYNGASGQASVNNDGGNSVPTVANGNMLGVDPKFVQSGVDFHLQGSSPALNAGASGYGLATSGAVNIGAEGVSGTTSTTVSSGSSGTTPAPTGGGTTSVPVDSGTTSASTGGGTTPAPTGSGTTSTSTGGGTTSASTGSGTTPAPTGGGTTSAPTGSGTTSATTGSGTTSATTGSGTTSASDGSSGINHSAHTWHDARAAFHDAMSTSVNDWNATKAAFQNAPTGHGVTRGTLQNAQKVMNLLNGVDTTNSTQVSAVNAPASKVQSQAPNTVNHDATLAAQTVAADGSTGDPGLHHGQNDFSLAVHHFGHLWG